MSFIDYYSVLGIPSDADDEAVRQSYKDAARQFHPDVNRSPGAAAIFREANDAYQILSNRANRTEYDRAYEELKGRSASLYVTTYYSRRHVLRMEQAQLLYVLVKIRPRVSATLSSSAPLNLCLVVDRSKSMQGDRLEHVKEAARVIIDECDAEDIFSLVTFSDRGETVVPPQPVENKQSMKAEVNSIRADGATAMLEGLQLGMNQVERYRDPRFVNHIMLITDGRTYGDEKQCLALAAQARESGIGISGMGIGDDWNDNFLDELTSQTGGSSAYVTTGKGVSAFLHSRVRSLATAFIERGQLTVAPSVDAELQEVVRLSPNPTELPFQSQPIALGTIDGLTSTALAFKFLLNTASTPEEEFLVGRVAVRGDVLGSRHKSEHVMFDLNVELSDHRVEEEPPPEILDALGKLRLYQLQEKAREAVEIGDVQTATRHLEHLATRLLEEGYDDLARSAMSEMQSVQRSSAFSEEGAKQLKYGTRALMPSLDTHILLEKDKDDD